MTSLDPLDLRIMKLFAAEPRVGVLAASRRLGVARGTVQARLDRLDRANVVTGWGPTIDAGGLGWPVSAFATLQIAQGHGHGPVAGHLRSIPEVLEAYTITGETDMLVRIVARSNADLQRVIDRVVGTPDVVRASTVIVLATEIEMNTMRLITLAAASSGDSDDRVKQPERPRRRA